MNTELLLRISLLVLFVAFIAHRGYYSRKMRGGETVTERKETLVTRLAGVLGIAGFISTAIYIIYPPWMAWAALPFPDWLRFLGIVIALSGFALLQWSQTTLGKNWSDTPRLIQDQQLVTSGPYHWVRHPIYTAFLLIMTAPLLISANWFIGITWLSMTLIEVFSRIQYEEDLMLQTFGDAYHEQMKHTGRLLPRLTHF